MSAQVRHIWFGRFCILFLAAEWILFGSMHFTRHAETRAQVPDILPCPDLLVVVSGVLEVATGILVLVPAVRRWAAWSSLLLLILLLPAMYKIMVDPAALTGSEAGNRLFRIVLLPNNMLMAICSIYLICRPAAALARRA